MASELSADYVIVGGGLAGCVLASRLAHSLSRPSVLLIEAGPDPSPAHDVVTPFGGFALQGSELDWQYRTAPTPTTENRTHTLTAGKTLGGGSSLNYGGWSRGDAADYDVWSRLAGDDQRWSYAGLLPNFRRSERWHDKKADPEQHGFDGPVLITSVSASDPKRKYPLGEPLRRAWKELGVSETTACEGHNQGVSEWFESWVDGNRQSVHQVYPLDGVTVMTGTPVAKILFADATSTSLSSGPPTASGVHLQDGRQVFAHKEVILSAGALGTPALLQASGIGPAPLLSSLSIPVISDNPAVGAAYFDHFACYQLFKLRPFPTGLALGHPDLADPAFNKGPPWDSVVNEGLPRALLEAALDADGITGPERAALLAPGRCFVETMLFYHPYDPKLPVNGSLVVSSVLLTLPSSRGRISLSNQGAKPGQQHIEPNYFATALDRAALIYGVRRNLQLMLTTAALAPYIEAEVPPPGLESLTAESSDADIEARIRAVGVAHFHAAGSCSVGKALNAEMLVKEVDRLRVCDASVFPAPVGGHPQASMYAVAEMAAEMIVAEARTQNGRLAT